MRFRLCDETGELRPFVNIFLEVCSIRDLQGLDTPLTDGATLHVLHSVAGG
jgi:molybdopterin synthase sulfur carrier subunit